MNGGYDRPAATSFREGVRVSIDPGKYQVGSARIGTDPPAVVDPQLLVHDVAALWIADALAMPTPLPAPLDRP